MFVSKNDAQKSLQFGRLLYQTLNDQSVCPPFIICPSPLLSRLFYCLLKRDAFLLVFIKRSFLLCRLGVTLLFLSTQRFVEEQKAHTTLVNLIIKTFVTFGLAHYKWRVGLRLDKNRISSDSLKIEHLYGDSLICFAVAERQIVSAIDF